MNVRAGDLAINVGGTPVADAYRGRIYRVLRVFDGFGFTSHPAWWVDYNGVEYHCIDAVLRPIRDPGDDAVDETLLFSPSPAKESEKV